MKISEIESVAVFNGSRNFLFVVVRTDEGIVGVGENGLPGVEKAVMGAVDQVKRLLIGEDPFRIEHLWQVMGRGAFFPAWGAQAAAMGAIDIALWDIKGKALGVPVYELLGGRTRDKVLCYGHAGDKSVEGVIEKAMAMKAAGWKALRCAPPVLEGGIVEQRRAVRDSVKMFGALREAVGPEIELMIDLHTRVDLPEAVTVCRELEKFDPYFVEDPLRSEDGAAYRRLREKTHVPLAAGEQWGNKWQFREVIEEELIDYCRVDPCVAGGITESKKIAGWCEVHGIRLAVHNPLGPVATAAGLHLNLSCPNVGIQEQPGLPGIMKDVFPKQMEWVDGYLVAPTAPGLGVEIDVAAARKYPFGDWEAPQTRLRDGAVTNW